MKDFFKMPKMLCPFCKKEIGLLRYGQGWISLCCNRIIFNSSHLPGSEADNKNHRYALGSALPDALDRKGRTDDPEDAPAFRSPG